MILIFAGEASGDLYGADVASRLREKLPGVRMCGLGGERMNRAGVELLAGLDELAVMGVWEVALRAPYFWRLEKRIVDLFEGEKIDLVLLIDYPGLNLRLAREAHSRGIPVLYYVPPKVWAWKKKRVRDLAAFTDVVAAILPFEHESLRHHGVPAHFVGHPLLDQRAVESNEVFRARHGLDADAPILALFPGSRRQEVSRHLELFLSVAESVRQLRPDLLVAVARAPNIPYEILATDSVVVVDDSRGLMRHAHAALVKSGTTTLEAAVEGTPSVVVYRMHPVTSMIAHLVVDVPFISLPNLVVGREVVPELIQDRATEDQILKRLMPLLDEDSAVRDEMLRDLAEVRDKLGNAGAADRVVELALELISGSGSTDA